MTLTPDDMPAVITYPSAAVKGFTARFEVPGDHMLALKAVRGTTESHAASKLISLWLGMFTHARA